jgi:hypothetical protein
MYREPKGAMGRTLDKIITKISFYEGKTFFMDYIRYHVL